LKKPLPSNSILLTRGVEKQGMDSRNIDFKATKGTEEKLDKDTKTIVVKSADGTEKAFDFSG
jgi:hypothetical protein